VLSEVCSCYSEVCLPCAILRYSSFSEVRYSEVPFSEVR
jgi:hypothetical protein